MASKVYWVGLKLLVVKACEYWIKNQARIPADLRDSLGTTLDGLTAACAILIAYDNAHNRGTPSSH